MGRTLQSALDAPPDIPSAEMENSSPAVTNPQVEIKKAIMASKNGRSEQKS